MEIRKTFRYSTDYSRDVLETTISKQLDDGLPMGVVDLEVALLGLYVKTQVLLEASNIGIISDDELDIYIQGIKHDIVEIKNTMKEMKEVLVEVSNETRINGKYILSKVMKELVNGN